MNAPRHNRRSHARTTSPGKPLFEPLEGRQLFSRTFTLIAENVTLDPAIVAAIELALASSTDASRTVQPSNQRLDDASRHEAGSATDNPLQDSLLDKAKTGDRSLPGGRQNVSHEDLLRSTSNGQDKRGGRNDAQRAQLGKSGFGMTAPVGPTGRYDHLYIVIGDAEDLLGGRGSSLISDLMTSVSDRTARRPLDYGYESGPEHSQSDLGRTTLSDILGVGRASLASDGPVDTMKEGASVVGGAGAAVGTGAYFGATATVAELLGTARGAALAADLAVATGGAAAAAYVGLVIGDVIESNTGVGETAADYYGQSKFGEIFKEVIDTITTTVNPGGTEGQDDPMNDWTPGSSSGPIPDKGAGLVNPGKDFVGASGVFNLGKQYRAKTGQVKTPGAPDRGEVTPAPEAIPTGGSGPIPDRFGPDMGLSQPSGRA